MEKSLEHVGIAVKNLKASEKIFQDVLGVAPYHRESVLSESVETSFFSCQGTKVELLASLNEDGIISRFIEKRGEGIHHLAFRVPNLSVEINRLELLGYQIIQAPKQGAEGFLVCFLQPKQTNGVLIELVEKNEKI